MSDAARNSQSCPEPVSVSVLFALVQNWLTHPGRPRVFGDQPRNKVLLFASPARRPTPVDRHRSVRTEQCALEGAPCPTPLLGAVCWLRTPICVIEASGEGDAGRHPTTASCTPCLLERRGKSRRVCIPARLHTVPRAGAARPMSPHAEEGVATRGGLGGLPRLAL